MIATIYGLLYGDYSALHNRLIKSLRAYAPLQDTSVLLWCNQVCKKTKNELSKIPANWHIIFSAENIPKYIAMRDMFASGYMPKSDWIVWFDDDSYVAKSDWWPKTIEYIKGKTAENICYIGQPWYVHHLDGQWQFITESHWFKGLPPQMCQTKTKGKHKPGITFAQGAYWWLRSDIQRLLAWPDYRLRHNGGDTLLGEAIRQQGLPFHKFSYGVVINKAKRRGQHEAPAGAADRHARR
jgi:hypothetical protein